MSHSVSCDVTHDLISSAEYGIPDSALTASSELDLSFSATNSRLNSSVPWIAHYDDGYVWIKAEFIENRIVTSIRTQGDLNGNHVTQYYISTSIDGTAWEIVKDENEEILFFEGNNDGTSIVTNTLPEPVITRFIRLNVFGLYNYAALRWAIDGCPISV